MPSGSTTRTPDGDARRDRRVRRRTGEVFPLRYVNKGVSSGSVQVDAVGQIYDHDTAIPGLFRAYTQKTLTVDFASREPCTAMGLSSLAFTSGSASS